MPLTVRAALSSGVLAARKGASGQQKLSLAVLAVILLAWVAYIVYALTRRDTAEPVGSEMELAPNRKPYFDDDELETKRLDRSLIFSLAMLVVVAVGLPLYWLNEPSRQHGASRGFDNNAAKRGASLFRSAADPSPGLHFGCADCHGGMAAVGGTVKQLISDPIHKEVPARQVDWSVPPLNSVLLRFNYSKENVDPNSNVGTATDPVRTIIVFGRPGTPMPAWGLAGGGAMNDQQINDLVSYIASIQLSNTEAAKYWKDKAIEVAKKENKLDAHGNPVIDGQVMFDTNCARCHTAGYSYGEPNRAGGGGQFAPNITGGSEIRQFPDINDQLAYVTDGVAFGKGYGTGGIATIAGGGMPHFGNYLSADEIKAILAYERGL